VFSCSKLKKEVKHNEKEGKMDFDLTVKGVYPFERNDKNQTMKAGLHVVIKLASSIEWMDPPKRKTITKGSHAKARR